MKIVFLGTGEAFDENYPNNSSLVLSKKTNLLLDCGLTVPPQLWKFNSDKNFVDAIYISHQHADHFFGLPALLIRMWEEGREKPVTVICQKELSDSFGDFMDLAYKDFQKKFKFNINLVELRNNESIKINDLKLSFAPTVHSINNLAVKVSDGKNSICYSGDGMFNNKTEELYKNSDLLIQEAYLYDEEKAGHGCIKDSIKMAEKNNIKCLALTHINRDFRRNDFKKVKDKIKSDKVKIIIPESFDEYIF